MENGFAWHPTPGTPYLPGSSVKGNHPRLGATTGEDRQGVTRLLGGPGRAGPVAFLDAVPTTAVTLEADVLTPHRRMRIRSLRAGFALLNGRVFASGLRGHQTAAPSRPG